jgi:hypothetical protein
MSTLATPPLVSASSASTAHVDALADLAAVYDESVNVCVLRRAVDPVVHTEWLDHADVDRARIGHAAGGLPDTESGLIRSGAQIQQMRRFEVGLFKGEAWEGNLGRGAVHRSPAGGARRVLLTLEAL